MAPCSPCTVTRFLRLSFKSIPILHSGLVLSSTLSVFQMALGQCHALNCYRFFATGTVESLISGGHQLLKLDEFLEPSFESAPIQVTTINSVPNLSWIYTLTRNIYCRSTLQQSPEEDLWSLAPPISKGCNCFFRYCRIRIRGFGSSRVGQRSPTQQ